MIHGHTFYHVAHLCIPPYRLVHDQTVGLHYHDRLVTISTDRLIYSFHQCLSVTTE